MEGNFPRASGRIRGLARTPAAAWATPLASRTTKRRHPTIGLLVPAAIVALAATRAGDVDAQLPVHATADASREWSGWYAGGHVGYRPGSATVTLSDSRPMWSSNGFGSLEGGLHSDSITFCRRGSSRHRGRRLVPSFLRGWNGRSATGPTAASSPKRSTLSRRCAAASGMSRIAGCSTEPSGSRRRRCAL